MMDINGFIGEMTNDILKQKHALDMPVFLNFLKEELENAGIALTVKRCQTPVVTGNHIITSDVVGIQLDLSDHDKEKDAEIEELKTELESEKIKNSFFNNTDKYLSNMVREKDAEIEKYKKSFEFAKCERDKAVCEYQKKIDELTAENAELHCEIQAMNAYPDESIREPIKMADWIVHHFKQGEEYAIYERDMNGKLCYVEIDGEKVPVQTGEYEKHREVREIADYLLAYCKYHAEG